MLQNRFLLCIAVTVFLYGCKPQIKAIGAEDRNDSKSQVDFTIAFGSCDNQKFENKLWESIIANAPQVWIWGGDNIYSDTDDMNIMRANYNTQAQDDNYKKLKEKVQIFATWDDHDYGLNDGGLEFKAKNESQQEFLNFLGVAPNDARRNQAGINNAELLELPQGSINIIVLDTRYFRTALTKAKGTQKRYQPNPFGEGTVLGIEQWLWLENELNTSSADFNIIVSSIQFLASEHGFETWGNFPHEVERLTNLIANSKAKGVLLLSGDRHISEFSKLESKDLKYPLIDFTSSGLTHSYRDFKGEPNCYRLGDVISVESFGLLKFNFEMRSITMEMRGENNSLLQKITQKY